MLIKNKIIFLISIVLSCFFISTNINADELDVTASEIIFKKNNQLLIASGSVVITDSEGNTIMTDKAEYDKVKDLVTTFSSSQIKLKSGYEINSEKIIYDNKNGLISSNVKSSVTDQDGNFAYVDMFEYILTKHLFSSRGNIKFVDVKKNKYFFKEMYIDTKDKKVVGSDVKLSINYKNVGGLEDENDPRLAANTIFFSKEHSDFTNGIFTTCKKREDGKCPPWTLQAKKIRHDKAKKTIYYSSAVLKVYDIPLFYFPTFFHPDPSVERQSGFLIPFFTNKTSIGTGFALPYYWAIDTDRDLTFTPKIYSNHKSLFFTEYRQAFENSFLHLDTSFTQGYKDPTGTKTSGSRSHFFAKYEYDFSGNDSYESDLEVNLQQVSNDTYMRIHNIDTALVDDENTELKSGFKYKYAANETYFNLTGSVFEDLTKSNNDRYEYVLPNIKYGRSLISSQSFGNLNFETEAFYNHFDTNKEKKFLVNDFIWNSKNFLSKKGILNSIEMRVKNTNYESENNDDLKSNGGINEIAGVLALRSSLPMIKDSLNYSNIFSPKAMLRVAPGHMRNLSAQQVMLSYSNLFSTNKTSEIGVVESGVSGILGFDFLVKDKKNKNDEKFKLSLGQIFSPDYNFDLPTNSSMDQKISDLVGETRYKFSDNGNISYKFSVDHDMNTLNYNEISTDLTLGKIEFNLDYLEERNHIGNENYINSGITLNINDSNSLKFETKKNFRTDSTEFYNLVYQYVNDCLTAGLEFNRSFYEDRDLGTNDSIMFKISFKPFGGVKTPAISRE